VIVSASRRTDIPALYSDWFFRRLEEGLVLVPNPMNPMQVSRVPLTPDAVDAFVFWSKNPEPMMSRLERLEGYPFYFQFTLTPYGTDLETDLPDKDRLADTFQRLSEKLGPHRVVWRYDPVLLSERYTPDFHVAAFDRLASRLAGFTERCVISYVDRYPKNGRAMDAHGISGVGDKAVLRLADAFSAAGRRYGIALSTCSEQVDLSAFGIGHARCVDPELIERIGGRPAGATKDANQRAACGCCASVDIGVYHTCTHGCAYCYANTSRERALRNREGHDPDAPMLVGRPAGDARITDR
jgi:hypothetical protein